MRPETANPNCCKQALPLKILGTAVFECYGDFATAYGYSLLSSSKLHEKRAEFEAGRFRGLS